ncbi:hypothetical protein LAZ67_8002510, partial [Cordylochernes scorpioides]
MAEESAKPQPGATIGRDASSDPVVLNPNIDIPKYDGTEDPRPWIESLEEIGFLYHWADYIISRYAAMNMTGSAKTWLNLHKTSFTSWENIKIRLIQDFSLDANKEELKMKLNRMQHWNEPAIRFAEDILVLCNKVDPAMEEETKIEHVIGGLKKEYSFALYLNPPKTTDDLLVVCKKMDSFEKKYRERVEKSRNLYNGPRYSRPQQQSRYVPPTAARNYQTTSRPQAPVSNNYKNDSPPTPRQYRNNFPQPSTPRRPYNPNFVPKPNLQRNTYNKSQEVSKNRTEDGRPICFKCNKPGHVARYCRVKFIRILEEDPADTQEKVEEKCQMNEISEKSGPRLYADEQKELKQVLERYGDLFSSRLGRTNLAKHRIDTEDAKPIKHKPYRVSAKERDIIKEQIDEMLTEGIIRPSSSPWSFPVILVKKRDGKYRFCVDYRKLNNVTVKDVYPIPRIDEVMDTLQGSTHFSAIDLRSGYWQVEVEERDKEKTAFTTAHGLYEFNVMPFGLCNAPATFERNMENMLGNMRWQICLCYLDDVIIYSPDFPTHLKRLEAVFRCFRESNLRLNDKKCRFAFEELEILGYITSKHGIKPAEHNIKAVRNFPRPKKVKEVQSFLGMCSYYRKFIKDFSKIADPLTNLIKKSVSFTWTGRQEEAFQTLKTALLSPPILGHFNPNAPTYVHTDASNIGIGATLVQDIGGEEKVISYLSRTLSKAEQNYSTTEKECLAVVWSMSKLRPYLYGRHFKIVTDHHALCWLKNLKDPTGRLARWAFKIQEYDFDIIHKSGKKHLDADGLSRGPLPETDWDEDFERLFLNQITDEEDKFIESVKKNLNGSRRSIAQNFKVEDGCLFKKNPNPEGRAWLLVVPEKKKREIMKEYHNHMSNGHLGVARTMYRIKSKYFWPSMLKDVSEFVKTCHLCQSRKGSNQLPSGLLQPIPPANFPFERIGIDFVGPLPSTKNRKKWIIVLTDYYTRYAETKAVSEATVKEVSKFLVEDIFLRHGAPQYLISDRGSQFTSNLMKEVMKTCKIKHCFTTSYHPQTNGLTERLNRTLINMLSMYVNTDQKNWDEILPFITHAYNTTIQETTGYSPFFLMFGREPTSLLDDRNISVDIDKDDYDEYIKHHLDKINRTRKLVINNTIKTQEKMKKNYDKKHMERSYEPGELVAVWTPIRKIGKCEKLLRKYFGPYRILKKLSNVNYLIEPKDNPGQDPLIVHVSRIKPYFERIDELATVFYCKYTTCLHMVQAMIIMVGHDNHGMSSSASPGSSGSAGQEPGRPSIPAPTGGRISSENGNQKILKENSENRVYANPPAGVKDVNLAAARDVTLNLPAGTSSNGAARVLGSWADCIEDLSPGAEDDFTVVKTKKRRRESSNSPTAAAPSSNSGGARSSRRLHSSARSVPRAQEIPTTRTHITEARARQASSSEEHCVYLEHGPELQPFHYLRALDRLLGGTAGIIQISKVNGHQLLGLANRGLAERLINNGLEVEGTLLRAFPFRKRAERITVSNLPFFVEDSAIINALRPFGRITSIAPKMMKAGPYTYTDGRREAFIVLHEGMTTERLPTRLDITIKGEAWPAYLSTGIKCSRCHGQGHRRANCPLLAGLANNTRTAPPTTPAGVPPPTTPAPPQRSAAQPPAPTPSNPAMEVCSAPPVARAALHSSAPRPSPPAAPAFPMEETPPAPPPVTPAPSLQTPGSREPAAPTPDVEMSIVEETLASFTSSAKNATRVDLDAFIEGHPSVSFAKTDALGLGREEVLDLLSSRTKAQRKGPLVGLIGQILDLRPGAASNLYKVLGQVKAELRTTPAVPPTPTLPAPWPSKPTPPALHGEKTSPDIATPPLPLPTEFIDACYDQANDIIYELSDERYSEPLSDIGVTEGDIVEAIIFPDDREPLLSRLSTQKRTTLAGIVSAASERARSSDPFVREGLRILSEMLPPPPQSNENSRIAIASGNYANLAIDRKHANFAAACVADVTPSTCGALTAATNWAEQIEASESGGNGYTEVKHKRRRRDSPGRPIEQRSSGIATSGRTGATPRSRPPAGRATEVQVIRATRADIADARARQRSSTEDNCVFVEHCPDFGSTHYLQAVEELVGGAGNVLQVMKMDGQLLVGLSTKALAERLIKDGLDIGHTHLRAFPFKKRAERITVGNLPFFVDDAAVIEALKPYGDVTSIVPIRLRAGRYTFTDGRREAFILLKEGIALEKIPTRVVIRNKGNVLSAFISYGVNCSRCGRQGHRRANCPINPGRASNNDQPQPAPLPPGALSSVSRQQSRPTQAAPALPMEETPSAPPPVTPVPPLQAPEGPVGPRPAGSQHPEPPPARPDLVAPRNPLPAQKTLGPAAPTPDVEMSIVEETSASSTSSAKNATRVDLDAFIEKHPSVSFAGTDALGLEREEVLDLLSSRTKAQRKGPLLSPPQCDALAGLIRQILDLRPGAASNLYKVLRQVKAELRTTPAAVPPTPPLPAPRPAEPMLPTTHREELTPPSMTPPPPAPTDMEEDNPMTEEALPAPRPAKPAPPAPHKEDSFTAMITPPPPLPAPIKQKDLMPDIDTIFNEMIVEPGSRPIDCFYSKYTTCLHSTVRPRVARAPGFSPLEGCGMSLDMPNSASPGSPGSAGQMPGRPSIQSPTCGKISKKNEYQKVISKENSEHQEYVNPPAGVRDANLAAARDDITAPLTVASCSATIANSASLSWGDSGMAEMDANDGYTTVRTKKRRRDSPGSPAAAAPSSGTRGAGATRRPRSSTGWAPRAEEVRTTMAHIAEARARQASSTEDHCVYIERSPELEPYHYMRAFDRMLGGTREVFQMTKMNGHFLVGLANRGLAERLVNESLEVEGTLHRAFPFRKRAERITVGKIPFFVGDAAVISALSPFGRVTSIVPKLMKAGPYIYNDGRREAFIILREGMTIERLPTSLDISIKGEAWPVYLSSGIRCSSCRGQGHRRANCPLLAGRTTEPGPATPTSHTSVPPATAPRLPQQPSAQPPPPASPSPTMEVSDVPPTSRAALHLPAALRQSPPAPSALPAEDAPPAPPPVTPAPSLRTPGSREPAAQTPDVEMSIAEETSASSTSSAKNATRVDLDAFIEKHPSVSFAGTDALGLGREEVLDLFSSRTKAQRKGPLLSPPRCDALAGLFGQILDLRPGAASNLYKVLGQVKAELRTTPAVPPTPPLPAPRAAETAPPAPLGKESAPAEVAYPPPLPVKMTDEARKKWLLDLFKELNYKTFLVPLLGWIRPEQIIHAALHSGEERNDILNAHPNQRSILANFLGSVIERARGVNKGCFIVIVTCLHMVQAMIIMVGHDNHGHDNHVSVYGEECMSIQMVRRWRSWFLEGRQNVHDDERSGSPVTATDNAAVAAVRNVVEADRRVTIDEIMIRLLPGIEIRRSLIGTIMSDVLNFLKVCTRWVPRLLLENHKQQRMEAARTFLEMHQRDGDQLFSRIVTGDESWVHHSTPETKRQSMVWKKPEESAPKKAKVTISAGKVMAMENFKWEIFTHPPYSPELAPSDFHLYPALKWHLGGKHFANDDEVQAEANHWLRRQDTAWYNSGMPSSASPGSSGSAGQGPGRPSIPSPTGGRISRENGNEKIISKENSENRVHANPPTGVRNANLVAARGDVTTGSAAATSSNGAARVLGSWVDSIEDQGPGEDDDFTVIKSKKRRRDSPGSPAAAAPSSGTRGAGATRRPRSSTGWAPRAEEVRTTRAHIAEARARQASSTEDHCVYIKRSPELEPYHYMRALDRMLGETREVFQMTKMNGHFLVGLANRGLAERLEVEGTLHRAFPFRKRAERITVGNLPFFVGDAAPPPPASPSPTMEVPDVPPASRAAPLPPAALRPSPPAPSALPVEDAPPAPPPVTPAPSLRAPGGSVSPLSAKLRPSTQDIVMTAIEESSASSTSSSRTTRNATRIDLDAFIETHPSVSFAWTDALGLGREEALDLISSRTKAQRNGPLLSPPQCDALAGLIRQILDLRPGAASNLYKVLGQVKAELRTTPAAVPPTPPLPAPRPAEPTPPAPQEKESTPTMATPPPPPSAHMEDNPALTHWKMSQSLYHIFMKEPDLGPTSKSGIDQSDLADATLNPRDREDLIAQLLPRQRNILAQLLGALLERALDLDPFLRGKISELRASCHDNHDMPNSASPGSLGSAGQMPGRPIIQSPTGGKISKKNEYQKVISKENSEHQEYVNPPAGVRDANLAAARDDVTAPLTAASCSATIANPASLSWGDSEMAEMDANDGYTTVRTKKRRRDSPGSPAAAAPSSGTRGAGATRRPRSSTGWAPRAEEVRTTRAHIAEARARQASSTEDHCVYIERSPELEPYHYMRALDRMLGWTREVFQMTKMNGHFLVGLANRGLAERLVNEGLEVEGTLHRAFPFLKRAESITVGNLPFFVGDAAVISALSPFGRVTSIAPKLMKAGPYIYNDGRREAFIILREGMTIERLPTRLDISIKGEAWPAYLSSGIRCSRCRGQGHRRANCPLLAWRTTEPGPATPTSPTSVLPATAPRLPQQPSAQPPPPASPSPTMVSDVPPTNRAALHPPAALRQSPPAPSALPAEDAPPAPPPVTPAPSLRTPGSREPAAPTPDVEMSIVEETSASSKSTAKNATRIDLDAFIERHPSVSFTETDALGLGREEVLDLLSSRTKAQRNGPLLPPPQCDALAGLIRQILDLRPGAASNLYKVLGQVKAELRTTPAAVPTPPLPAPRPAEPAPPAPHGEKTTPDMATPPPPLTPRFFDERWREAHDIIDALGREPYSEHLSELRLSEGDITDAIICPEDREPLIRRLSTRRKNLLAEIISAAIERARDIHPFAHFTVSTPHVYVDRAATRRASSVFLASGERKNVAGSPHRAEHEPGRLGSDSQTVAEISAENQIQDENSRITIASGNYANLAIDRKHANSAAACVADVTPSTSGALTAATNWAEQIEASESGGDGFTEVKHKRRRRDSPGRPVEQRSSGIATSGRTGATPRSRPPAEKGGNNHRRKLMFFVDDAAVIEALKPYGDVTSIVPIRLRAGRYTFTDGRREAFILLKEGIALEKTPTRVVIRNKGNVLSAFISYGVKCSRCGRQGHRRANCPINPGRASNNGQPQPAPLPPGASFTVSRQQNRPTPAAPALPMEETPSAPPPVTPAPPLQAPEGPVGPRPAGSQHPEPPPARPDLVAPRDPLPAQKTLGPAAPTPDVEMSIVEETSASSTSSAKNATRIDLDAFIERHPSVSFAGTDALGLGREEVLDLLSSRTKAQRNRPLLSPPQGDALAGLIGQILDLRPGAASNLYKVLGQVKAELRTTPAAVPTPPLPAPRPAEPAPPAPHGEKTTPDMATPPPPLSPRFIDERWREAHDIIDALGREPYSEHFSELRLSEGDITDAIICPEDREPLLRRLSTRRKNLLAEIISAAVERARDIHPFA